MSVDLEQACAALFDASDPAEVAGDLRTIIEAAIVNQPRSLQKHIGPSELGNECDRCLVHKLAGTTEATEAAWLPFIGTCVHEQLETIFLQHEATRGNLGMPSRFLPEHRVTVGKVAGIDITGSTDLFDTHSGTVCDWKIVGTTTLRSARSKDASLVYQRQAMLYGKGWEDRGYTVTSVLIYFLPRNAVSLADGYAWQAPYERTVAEETLAHADALARSICAFGLNHVLANLPPHTNDGFTCRRFPDWQPPAHNTSDPFGS